MLMKLKPDGVRGINGIGPIRRNAVAIKQFPMTDKTVGYRILSQICAIKQFLC